MDNQRKLTKNLSIVGLILQFLSYIAIGIFAWLFIRQYLKIISEHSGHPEEKVKELFLRYLFFVIIISVILIAKFLILIILAVKTTSSGNRLLFIIGIFIGLGLFAFIGFINELRISRKSNVSSNWKGPQMPSNNSNASIPPMPQY